VNHRITQRLAAALIVALLATGASECQTQDKESSNGSAGKQQAQQDTSDSSNSAADKCTAYRAAYDDMKPTAEERKLEAGPRLKASYKSMQKFYKTFAQIFPESATAANALATIYDRALQGTLTKAEEAKIGGYDDKIGKVIDAHCPNSGFPAS